MIYIYILYMFEAPMGTICLFLGYPILPRSRFHVNAELLSCKVKGLIPLWWVWQALLSSIYNGSRQVMVVNQMDEGNGASCNLLRD